MSVMVLIPVHSYRKALIHFWLKTLRKNYKYTKTSIDYLENLKRPKSALWYCHAVTMKLNPDISVFTGLFSPRFILSHMTSPYEVNVT